MLAVQAAPPAAAATPASAAWTTQVAGGPSARYLAPLAYDAATKSSVLFGGVVDNSVQFTGSGNITVTAITGNDTWLWNGSAWSQAHPATSPSTRFGAAEAYDPATSQLVLFGGGTQSTTIDSQGNETDSGVAYNDTWTWNGTTWTQLHPSLSPAGRAGAQLVYDAAIGKLVLVDGDDAAGNGFTDTWLWDGTTWQRVQTANSPLGLGAAMAYDPVTGQLLLFDVDGSTLAFTGSTWTPLATAATPPARDSAAMVYDAQIGKVVLTGGEDESGNVLSDTWAWDGVTWSQLSASGASPVAGAGSGTDSSGRVVVFGGVEASDPQNPSASATTAVLDAAQTPITRTAGSSRIATAVATSQAQFAAGAAQAVVLARADAFPDALSGGPLAAAKGGPLLLTATTELDPITKAEIQRVLPAGGMVYLLGGTVALSTNVDAELKAAGYSTTRIFGNDRFATAVAVADALGDPSTVFEATGLNFPDALAGVPAAISAKGAILLTNGASQATATSAYLAAHPPATRYALGGAAAAADPGATRLVGADRYATSALVAATFFPAPTIVGAAVGSNYPDALAAGVQLGLRNGPLVLVPASGTIPASVGSYLSEHSSTITSGVVFGGTAAVGADVYAQVQAAIS